MSEQKEKYKVQGTKIPPEMDEVLNKICDVMQVDVYHLLQWFIYTLIRASSPQHELTPEIQKLMTMMEHDAGWQKAFNLCNPDKLNVSQCILILEQKGHKGFGAVMVNKPWMGDATQTECVDDILERVTEVTMQGIYRRLREIGSQMDCQHLSDILLSMIDAQTVIELDDENRREMQCPGDYTERGVRYAYGKKTKSKHHRTPDSLANRQQTIRFDDSDRMAADSEASGEIRQTDEPPEDMRPFGEEW